MVIIHVYGKGAEQLINKVCGVVFDIKKTFDIVWHNDLYHNSHLRTSTKLVPWLVDYLNIRKFNVKSSRIYHIKAGVTQAGILSSTLCSMYINNITELNKFPDNNIYSLLIDDLFAFNVDHNIRKLQSFIVLLREGTLSLDFTVSHRVLSNISYSHFSLINSKLLLNFI